MKKNDNYSIAEPFTHEIVIEKSRFIAHLFPTDTATDAKNVIAQIKKQYADASHNCSAYIIQNKTIVQKSSDDGEPSGTAGVPMLQALIQRDMINITAVVTRYFGGIKLGTGGLIRAYSHAVLAALDAAPLMTYKTFTVATLPISYEEISNIYTLVEKTGLFTIEATSYEPETVLTLAFESKDSANLQEILQAQLLRQVDLTIVEEIVKKVELEV